MEKKSGIIEEIIFRNEDNGYTVFEVLTGSGPETFVGTALQLAVGEEITARGEYTEHSVYGRQFLVRECVTKVPQGVKAMERYLGSGAVKGIGPVLAGKIVDCFGEETFRIMEEEPEKLAQVSGISHKKAMAIAEAFFEQRNMRRVFLFLQEYELSMTYAVRIYEAYQEKTFFVVKEQPYRLAAEIDGIGFRTADRIAEKSGVARNSPERILSGIRYVLEEAAGEGHVYLPKEELFRYTCRLLGIEIDYLEPYLMEMQMKQQVVVRQKEGGEVVYLESYYRMERYIASKLLTLQSFSTVNIGGELNGKDKLAGDGQNNDYQPDYPAVYRGRLPGCAGCADRPGSQTDGGGNRTCGANDSPAAGKLLCGRQAPAEVPAG